MIKLNIMFSNAIVRKPGKSIIKGLTKANFGIPDYHKALDQYESYVYALSNCGLKVKELDADENFPDSIFVEDTALLTPHCAIITNTGAQSRRDEIVGIKKEIKKFYADIEEILSPGTVEAGDIMMVGNHFYIGLSNQFINFYLFYYVCIFAKTVTIIFPKTVTF